MDELYYAFHIVFVLSVNENKHILIVFKLQLKNRQRITNKLNKDMCTIPTTDTQYITTMTENMRISFVNVIPTQRGPEMFPTFSAMRSTLCIVPKI